MPTRKRADWRKCGPCVGLTGGARCGLLASLPGGRRARAQMPSPGQFVSPLERVQLRPTLEAACATVVAFAMWPSARVGEPTIGVNCFSLSLALHRSWLAPCKRAVTETTPQPPQPPPPHCLADASLFPAAGGAECGPSRASSPRCHRLGWKNARRAGEREREREEGAAECARETTHRTLPLARPLARSLAFLTLAVCPRMPAACVYLPAACLAACLPAFYVCRRSGPALRRA